jgi:hypothetical protein
MYARCSIGVSEVQQKSSGAKKTLQPITSFEQSHRNAVKLTHLVKRQSFFSLYLGCNMFILIISLADQSDLAT